MFFKKNPTIARSHPNIALVKYWGKSNDKLIIPTNSSISLTISDFYTDTGVEFDPNLKQDYVKINGKFITGAQLSKVTNFLDIIREKAHSNDHAFVSSISNIPVSAGLASSSAAFAALAAAASTNINLTNLTPLEWSKLARRGSGSASRSIFGGFVEWQKGDNDSNSYAFPLQESTKWDIKIIAVVLNRKNKAISSRVGMKRSVTTSPYYSQWIKISENDLINMKKAIKEKKFSSLGHIAEQNAMNMHALTLSSDPSFTYFNSDSLKVMKLVKKFRENNIECYYTMDAGPNVKIITQKHSVNKIINKLNPIFGSKNVIVTGPGKGTTILKKSKDLERF